MNTIVAAAVSVQKLSQKALLISVPNGAPWQMIAVDILEVPISTNNNHYLLVVHDYLTRWVNAIPLPIR